MCERTQVLQFQIHFRVSPVTFDESPYHHWTYSLDGSLKKAMQVQVSEEAVLFLFLN